MGWNWGSNLLVTGADESIDSSSEVGTNYDDNAFDEDAGTCWESTITDLVSGGSASASSYTAGHVPAKAFAPYDEHTTDWTAVGVTEEWIKYDFGDGNSAVINQAVIRAPRCTPAGVKNFLVQYSDDNIAWTTFISDTYPEFGWGTEYTYTGSQTDNHRYYRVFVTDKWGGDHINIGILRFNLSEQWLRYDYGMHDNGDGTHTTNQEALNKFTIKLNSSGTAKNFRIEGSHDGTSWTVLITHILRNVTTEQSFITRNTTEYRYFRLVIVDTYGSNPEIATFKGYIGTYTDDPGPPTDGIPIMSDTVGNMVYDNLLYSEEPTVTLSESAATGFEKEYLWDKNPGQTYRSSTSAANTITFDFAAAIGCHGAVLLNHNLQSGDSVVFQTSTDNFSTIAEEGVMTINDCTGYDTEAYGGVPNAYFISLEALSYRYYRFTATLTNSQTYFECGQVFLPGGIYEFEQNYRWNAEENIKTVNLIRQSQSGALNKEQINKSWQYVLTFDRITLEQQLHIHKMINLGDSYVMFSPESSQARAFFGSIDSGSGRDQFTAQKYLRMIFTETPV